MDGDRLEPLDDGWDRGLAIVAHPDDLEYGAASAMARSYLEHLGLDPDAFLRGAAEAAGRRLGCEHGVTFEVVRP